MNAGGAVPDLSIVTISTNEGEELDRCLEAALMSAASFEYLVINNASSDKTASLLREKYRSDRVVEIIQPVKKGFIENCNLGIERSRGKYVLMLNPDTVVSRHTFEVMIDFMERHPEAACATCRLCYPDGKPQAHCRRFPTPWVYLQRMLRLDALFPNLPSVKRYLLADFDHFSNREVDWFITAFFFMRRSVIEAIGKFDQTLRQPFYCEDLEWCYRARLKGYKNYFVADTQALHSYKQSSRRRIGYLTLVHVINILLFFRKHGRHMLRGEVCSQ